MATSEEIEKMWKSGKYHECPNCKGAINPSWTRGDGDYRHCDCKDTNGEYIDLKIKRLSKHSQFLSPK